MRKAAVLAIWVLAVLAGASTIILTPRESHAQLWCYIKICVKDSIGADCDDDVWWDGLKIRLTCNDPEEILFTEFEVNCDSFLLAPNPCWQEYGIKAWAYDPDCSPTRVTIVETVNADSLANCRGTILLNLCLLPDDINCD